MEEKVSKEKTSNKNQLIAIAVIAVVVAAGAFFGGMFMGKSSATNLQGSRGNTNFRFRNGGMGGPGSGMMGGFGGNRNANPGDFAVGQIISKDASSITVKTRDGGSKIIYFSNSTSISKSVKGNATDLKKGEQVMITGKSSSDGSLSAKNIQIRPRQ